MFHAGLTYGKRGGICCKRDEAAVGFSRETRFVLSNRGLHSHSRITNGSMHCPGDRNKIGIVPTVCGNSVIAQGIAKMRSKIVLPAGLRPRQPQS